MANRYLIGAKKSILSRPNSVNKYDGFVKEIPPSLKYASADTRYNMPGSVNFEITIPSAPQGDCSAGGYWINRFTKNLGVNNDYVYPLSQYTDYQCNYFCAYETLNPSTASYQKFDSSGNSLFSVYETYDAGEGISEVTTDSLGNLYVCYGDGLRKLDSEGNMLWEKYFQNVKVYGVSVNSSGEIYVNGDSMAYQNDIKCIAKLNSDGDVLIQKEVSSSLSNDLYTYNGIKLDSQENVIWSIIIYGYDGDGKYSNLFLKLDPNLNVIWDTRLDPTDQVGDYDVTEFGLDSEDNLYANHYFNTVAKYDSNGDFVWARVLSSSLTANYVGCQGLGVSQNGHVFYLGPDSKGKIDNSSGEDVFYITKMNKDGDLDFISYISGSYGLADVSWNYAQAMTTVKNNALNVCFESINRSEGSYFTKLPLTQVLGTYGDLQFIDITNDPNLEFQPFTYTSRISTVYTIVNSNLFDTTKSKTYYTQIGTGIEITNVSI